MDQPDAAETAAAVSTSAGVAGEAHQPAPPGQQVDAEAAGLASSQSVDVQTGNAHSTTENEPAMAERSGDAKQKPSRRELKPLVPEKPPSAPPVKSAAKIPLKALPAVSPAPSATVTPVHSATVTPAQSAPPTPRAAGAAAAGDAHPRAEAADPPAQTPARTNIPGGADEAASSPRTILAAPSQVVVETGGNEEMVLAGAAGAQAGGNAPEISHDEELTMLRLQLKEQGQQLQALMAQALMARVEPAAAATAGGAHGSEQSQDHGGAGSKKSHKRTLLPETIPEMEVLEEDQMVSDFSTRMKRQSLAARGRSKSVVRGGDHLSDDVRLFMSTWREAREKEVKATILEELRRAYIKLAREDEECNEFNLVLASLADKDGTAKGVCEYLRERLRGSFKVLPEEVVTVRSCSGLPGQSIFESSVGDEAAADAQMLEPAPPAAHDASINSLASDSGVDTSARESLLDGLVTRKRFRHELARALRTEDHSPCVEVLILGEKPRRVAVEGTGGDAVPDKDLFDINLFCEKYGNLDRWARNTAKTEAAGIRNVVRFLQEGASETSRAVNGPAFMLGAPKEVRSESGLAMIETVQDFLSLFYGTEQDVPGVAPTPRDRRKADISRLSRADACNWIRAALIQRDRMQQKDPMVMGTHPEHVFDPASLLVLPDPCAFAPTKSLRPADAMTRAGSSSTASLAPSVAGSGLSGGASDRVNLYALFPGWQAEHVSVREFIKRWLVSTLKVPLSNDGNQWDRGLGKPVLDVKVGGITARCIGTSGAQWALLKGKCCMSVLPWDKDGTVYTMDKDLQHRSVTQVVSAYKQAAEDNVSGGGGGGDGVLGLYQVVVTADGSIFIDHAHMKQAAPKTADTTLMTLLDTDDSPAGDDDEVASTRMVKIARLEEEFVVQAAVGKGHLLCLTSEGRIWGFGCSLAGQMGYLATSISPSWNFVNINSASNSPSLPLAAKVVQIACGADHSLALVDNGLVYGFGSNSNGQLGMPNSREVFEPTVLLKFERMSNVALLNAKGTYVRHDFDTVAASIPWIVAVACGDRHSVMLTASGRIFACGDNSSGQIGYSGTVQDPDDVALAEYPGGAHGMAGGESEGAVNVSEILQFPLPVLVEGGHVPSSIAQVACGSRHTSVLSHSGRIYVYGGVTASPTSPPSAAKCGGSIMWCTMHDKANLYLEQDAYASSLVYHGDPYKVTNLSCCGDYTLASFFDSSRGSAHSSPGYLDLACFWWKNLPTPASEGMCVAQLQFQQGSRQESSRQKAVEGDSMALDELHEQLLQEIAKERERSGGLPPFKRMGTQAPRSHGKSWQKEFLGSALDVRKVESESGPVVNLSDLHDMASMLELVQFITRLYAACRSQYPGVREEAVSLWGSAERLLMGGPAEGGLHHLATPFRSVVTTLLRLGALSSNARKQFVIGCQLVLYRATEKRSTLPAADVEHLLSIGVNSIWRPHLLHDKQWAPGADAVAARAGSATSGGPFVLLEEDVLMRKLENAGAVVYVDSKVIIDAVKELSPRADLAMLFLMRRANISNVSTAAMTQLLSKEYMVEVRTGDGPRTGTDSQVFLELVGTLGSSGERALVYSDNTNAFESAQTDIFTLSSTELGHIKKVVVRNEGAAAKSKWKLDEVRIWQAGNASLVYDFPYYGWMDARIPSDVMRQELWFDPVPKARERYQYEIKVATMDAPNAGTNSSVFIILHGEVGDSKRQRLEETVGRRTARLFQKGQTSTFIVPVSQDIGALSKLVIGTTSWGTGASWLLESVEVTRFRKGPSQADFVRETSTYKFRNRNADWMSEKRACCQLELYPEADGSRGTGMTVTAPVISPMEGTYREFVDIFLATSELEGDVLLTVFYVPDSDREGRVKSIDWLKDANNQPQRKVAEAVALAMCEESPPLPDADAAEHAASQGKKKHSNGAQAPVAPGAARARRYYQLPDSFYDKRLDALDDSGAGRPVTYKMKANENLRLGRCGGSYRLMVLAVKAAVGSESYSTVEKSGEICIKPSETQRQYRVHVFTGTFPEAGTSANVSIIIKGKGGSQTQPTDLNWANARSDDKEAVEGHEGKPVTTKTGRAQAFLEKGGRKLGNMLGLFENNSEAVFEFEAEDVGEVAEILIWHDNRMSSPINNPEWYLHRVEVITRNKDTERVASAQGGGAAQGDGEGGDEAVDLVVVPEADAVNTVESARSSLALAPRRREGEETRVFMCRKWLTSRDTQLGTQARLVYSELASHAKLIETYDFAIVMPKTQLDKHKNLPFEKLVLFGDRIKDGLQISLPKTLERVFSLDHVMFCFKSHVGLYFGVLRGAMFVDRGGAFLPASRGVRVMVTCYERAAYNTVHFVPALVDDSFAHKALANLTATCSPGWAGYGELKTMLRISSRQHAVEPSAPLDDEMLDGNEVSEGAGRDAPLFAQRHKEHGTIDARTEQKARKDSTRTILNTLEIWSNILESEDFDEEESLQRMIPACARLTLVAVAKHGALFLEHLDKLKFVFNEELFPMENQREMETHADLAIMTSVFAHLDKWRRIEPNTYELADIRISHCFAWNMLYWQCCTNPPEPEAIAFVLEHGGFESHDDHSDSAGTAEFVVTGLEADFALMLHFLVLRQMARYDVLALQEEESEAARRKAIEAIENRNLGLQRRWSRKINMCLRAAIFPILFLLAVIHMMLNMLTAALLASGWNYWNDRRMFSQFAEDGVLQPTKEESRRLAEKWRQVCSGNFSWLKRRCPITQEERRRQEQRHQLIGKWTDFIFECRRQFMMAMVPQVTQIGKSMTRWFSIGTTQRLASEMRKKSTACRKRELVLEELCRFSPVRAHRTSFAYKQFLRGGVKNLVLLALLVYCLFDMLGLGWYWDAGSDLSADLRQMLVDDDFDDEHNTFNEIDKWEDWWNFAKGTLAGVLTAQQVYAGSDYRGDLRFSPVLLRQVRTQAGDDGVLPVWGPGPSTSMEDKLPLQAAIYLERHENNTRDGCVWSSPPNAHYLSAYTRGQRYRKYPASGYMVELTKDDVVQELARLEDGGWFDAATRFVSVEGMVYSKSRDRMAYVNLGAEVSVAGWTRPVVQIISFKPSEFGVWHYIFMIIFVQTLGNEALCILSLGPRRYFTGAGNIINLLMAGCIFSVFICQMVVISQVGKYDRTADNPWPAGRGGAEAFDINWPLVTMVEVQRVCASISILIWFLKFLVHFSTVPVCGPIVLGIFELLRQPVILFFLFCYIWMLSGFALCFFFLSADAVDPSFRQVWNSLSSMVRAGLAGDFEFTTYESMDTFTGPVLFVIMIIMSQIIMTNLFIAIISNEYDVARKKGERKWRNTMALYMAQELIDSLPVDSSGNIDMHSSAMLVGHDLRSYMTASLD